AHLAPQEVNGGLHHGERIAQLVTDRRGELPDGREALARALSLDVSLPVGLEHDRELDVADSIHGHVGAPALRVVASTFERAVERAVHRAVQARADEVHRAEHEPLIELDLDVHTADAGAALEVRVVVDASDDALEPVRESVLLPRDLRLPSAEHGPSALVLLE